MERQDVSLFLKPKNLKPPAEHGSEITRRFAMNAVGRMIAVALQDRSIRLYDARNCEEMQKLQDEFLCTSIAFSPKGDIVATGGVDRVVKLWDIRSGTVIATLQGHTYPVLSLSFSPDGDKLVSSSGDTSLIVWDLNKSSKIHELRGHKLYVVTCDWEPDGHRIVSGGVDAFIGLWDSQTGERLDWVEGHRTAVQSVRWSANADMIASGSSDQSIVIWNPKEQSLEQDRTFLGHSSEVRAVAFSSDTRFLASGSADKDLFVWRLESGEIEGESSTMSEIDGIEWFPDRAAFLTSDGTGAITSWEVVELESMLQPFNALLEEIQSDSELTRKDEFISKFEDLQSQYDEEILRDKRVFYILWQCKRALGLLKGSPRKKA